MSTTQKTLEIPQWLTSGSGWTTSSKGTCRIKVTRDYGSGTAKIEPYWGYCSPGGAQASVNCIITVGSTTKNEQLFGQTVHSSGVWYYANGSSFTVSVGDSAGSLSISVYMIVNAGTSGKQSSTVSGTVAYDSKGETTPTLNKSSCDMGSAVTITCSPYVSSFSHKLYYSLDSGKNWTLITNLAAGTTSYAWTVPTSFATGVPNSTSRQVLIGCDTYSGSSRVGSTKTVSLTATVPASYVPSISGHAISEATSGIASKFGAYVQSKSTLKVVTTASGSNGSTISSVQTVIEGRSYSGSTITSAAISGSGTIAVKTTVTDSRGRTATKTTNVTAVAYSPPTISTATVARTSDSATTATCSYNFSIASVGGKNSHVFYIQYLSGSTWTDIVRNSTDLSKNGSVTSGSVFGADTTTQVRFVAQDYFTSVSVTRNVGPTFTLINFGAGGKSVALGKLSANTGRVEVGLPTSFTNTDITINGTAIVKYIANLMHPVGSVYITTNSTNPGTYLGGTWVQYAQGRTLVGQGTGSDGTTSMTFSDGGTGGKYNTTLTIGNLPAHTHRLEAAASSAEASGYGLTKSQAFENRPMVSGGNKESSSTGSGTAFSNLQPYQTVYFWRRTA